MINRIDIWISLKYILPKTREKFFSLITVFSFLGIALGVATLIIVMSVMNGFREELTNKILGINGHLKVSNIFTENDDEKKIINNIKKRIYNSKVHAVISSQGLISVKNYSSGVLIKGVEYNFFQDREIFNNDFSSFFRVKIYGNF